MRNFLLRCRRDQFDGMAMARTWHAFSSHAVGEEASSRSSSTDEPCVHNNSQRALALVPNR